MKLANVIHEFDGANDINIYFLMAKIDITTNDVFNTLFFKDKNIGLPIDYRHHLGKNSAGKICEKCFFF